MTEQAARRAPLAQESAVPRSASIIEAFRSDTNLDDELLRIAARLAHQHQNQWDAETVSRDPAATTGQIATSKRAIDTLNSGRAVLIELLDDEIDRRLGAGPAQAPLHTETVGSVIDRLGIAWVRANNLRNDGTRDRARQALDQLRELATAYDDLIRDITAGSRRVPAWRLLKQYEAAS